MEWMSASVEDSAHIAREVLATLEPKPDSATVIGLSGELGAGKTTFTQAIARLLGIREQVTSPTFVIEKIYRLEKTAQGDTQVQGGKVAESNQGAQRFGHLIHIDAYRLEEAHELEILGWGTITADPANLILIEWPERVQRILPSDTIYIEFEYINETTRKIMLKENNDK